jgi:hypothetical protein
VESKQTKPNSSSGSGRANKPGAKPGAEKPVIVITPTMSPVNQDEEVPPNQSGNVPPLNQNNTRARPAITEKFLIASFKYDEMHNGYVIREVPSDDDDPYIVQTKLSNPADVLTAKREACMNLQEGVVKRFEIAELEKLEKLASEDTTIYYLAGDPIEIE